jgi:leader peptidase (prepilin peptidase) / N-methyltransferase
VPDLLTGLPLDLLLSPWALALLGLAVGSFLNVVVHRLPLMLERQWWGDVSAQLSDADSYRRVFGAAAPERLTLASASLEKTIAEAPPFNLMRPRSRCPSCGHQIRWYENIPVLSWLVLRGRCSACKTRIPLRYPLVELGTAGLFAALAVVTGPQPVLLLLAGAVATLLALSLIDWDTTVLPDALTLPLLWAGIAAAALGWNTSNGGLTLAQSVAGTAAGYLSLWAVYWLFKLATGKEGMGYGDFKLLAALGAWLGASAILPIVLMASVLGAVVGIAMKLTGSLREGRFVPFGPFLAGGGVVVMLVGTNTVLGWIGW